MHCGNVAKAPEFGSRCSVPREFLRYFDSSELQSHSFSRVAFVLFTGGTEGTAWIC